MTPALLVHGRPSLTPALSRWERENHPPFAVQSGGGAKFETLTDLKAYEAFLSPSRKGIKGEGESHENPKRAPCLSSENVGGRLIVTLRFWFTDDPPSPRPFPAGRGRIIRRLPCNREAEQSSRRKPPNGDESFPSPSGRGIKGEGE